MSPDKVLNCPHLVLKKDPLREIIKRYRGSTCRMCSHSGKNQWLCLTDGCHFVGCGSKVADHGTSHSLLENHAVSVNLHNSQVYCQQCKREVLLTYSPENNDPANSTTNITPHSPLRSVEIDEKPLGVCGLPNLGNTCYMNAALQALSNCPQLTEYFLQCSFLFDTHRPCLLSYYRDFLSRLWLPPRSSLVSPLSLVKEVKYLYPVFSGFSQHDSQEFLRVFLNHLHDELNSLLNNPPINGYANHPNGDLQDDRKKLAPHCTPCDRLSPRSSGSIKPPPVEPPRTSHSRTVITDVFQGKLISAVQCLSCNQVSCREEVFLDLSLSLARPENSQHPMGNKLLRKKTSNTPVKLDSLQTSRSPLTKPCHLRPSPTNNRFAKLAPYSTSDPRRFARRFALHDLLEHLPNLRSTVPFARRFLVQLIGLVALSFAWIVARFADIQGLLVRPTLSLTDCLSDYFSVAELDGENQYYCDHCKKHCNGLNETALSSLPDVLCLHLKRFRSHGTDTSKITTAVSFPLEGLDMRPYLHPDCTSQVTTYDLAGIICHRGDCGGGHYVACARNWHRNVWYEFDDERVYQLRPDQVEQLTSEAYVLFYRKSDSSMALIRKEADQMLLQYSHGPLRSTVYISRPWFVRFYTSDEPGPVSNSELLCQHKRIRPQLLTGDRDTFVVPVSEELWLKLIQRFGGGPIIREFTACSVCRDALLTRQHQELMAFDRAFEQCERVADYCGLYAISSAWFDSWKDFVGGTTFRLPGPIDNNDIVERGSPYLLNGPYYSPAPFSGPARLNRLKPGSAYNQLFGGCWELLWDIYGGGPTICMRQPQPLPCQWPVCPDAEDELSDSRSSSSHSLVHRPVLTDLNSADTDSEQLACPASIETNHTDRRTTNSIGLLSVSNPSIQQNGDTESGVYSTDFMSCSNFSSVNCSAPDEPPALYATHIRPTTSLSVDNLVALAKGDWKESAVSLDDTEADEGSALLNGFHSHSHSDLHKDVSRNPLIMAGDSSDCGGLSKSMCNGLQSDHRSPDHVADLKKSRLPVRI